MLYSKQKADGNNLTGLLTWVPSWQSCSPRTWWSSPPLGPASHPSRRRPSGRHSWPLPSGAGCRPPLSSAPALTAPCQRTTEGSEGRGRTGRVVFEPKRLYRRRGIQLLFELSCISIVFYVLQSKYLWKSCLSTIFPCIEFKKTEAACQETLNEDSLTSTLLKLEVRMSGKTWIISKKGSFGNVTQSEEQKNANDRFGRETFHRQY